MTQPLSVLFLCTANICRSPAMELIARDLAGDTTEVVFASSGTHARTGHRINPVMATTIPELDSSRFRSRRLKPDMILGADVVLTAEALHREQVLDDYPQLHRQVFSLGQFAAAVSELPDVPARELVAAVAQRRMPAAPEHDVADPYRRGEKAAATATGTIRAMLNVVVPRLAGDS